MPPPQGDAAPIAAFLNAWAWGVEVECIVIARNWVELSGLVARPLIKFE